MWEKESGLVGMMEESLWDLAIPYLTKLFGCQSMVGSLRTATQHSMDGFNTASCGSLLATGPHPVVVCQLDHNETRTTSADLSKVPLFLISRFLCMKFHALGFMEHSFVWVLCQQLCMEQSVGCWFLQCQEYLNGPVNPLYKDDADFHLCLRGLWYPSLSLCSTSHSVHWHYRQSVNYWIWPALKYNWESRADFHEGKILLQGIGL